MAVLGRLLISSAERLDLPDLLSIDSYGAGDWQYFMQSLVGTTQPYILSGFDIANPAGALGTPSCSITVANSVMYYPTSGVGAFYYGLPAGALTSAPLVPQLRQNAVNFVYLTLTTTNTSADVRAFWDPNINADAGGEFTQVVDTESVLTVQVGVSTGAFPVNTVPIAQVTVGPVVITAIEDCRYLMFRLGTGGIDPNPNNSFQFRALPSTMYERLDTPDTMTLSSQPNPFQGGDKNIYTLKEWMDVVMTKLKELGGTVSWFDETPALNLTDLFTDVLGTTFTSKGLWISSSITPGVLSWTEDIVIQNVLDPRTTVLQIAAEGPPSVPGSITLLNGQVAFIDQNRSAEFNVLNQPVAWLNGADYVNTIGGAVGLFANLLQGDYIRAIIDPDIDYVRVENFYSDINATGAVTSPALAKSVLLSGPYQGTTGNFIGVDQQGIYTAADVDIVYQDDPSLLSAGGNALWLAFRSDIIEGIATATTTELTLNISGDDGTQATVTSTSGPHGLINGDRITISGSVNFNHTYIVQVDSSTVFSIQTDDIGGGGPFPNENGVSGFYAIIVTQGTTSIGGIPLQNADHGFATNDTVIIAGTVNYNGSYPVSVRSATSFEIALAGAPPPSSFLGRASAYGILAATAITNSVGTSTVNGNLGESPGSTVTGAFTVSGSTDLANTAAANAQTDAHSAFTTLQTLGLAGTTIPSELGGQTLNSPVSGATVAWQFASGTAGIGLTGTGTQTLTLNGPGNFVIYTASTLTTGASAGTAVPAIALTGGALAKNVYFVVGSSATINQNVASIGATFNGNIIAQASITTPQSAIVNGSLIALSAAITLSNPGTITAFAGGPPPPETVGTATLAKILVRDSGGSVSLVQGESVNVDDEVINNMRLFIGMQSLSDTHPTYDIPGTFNGKWGEQDYNSLTTDNVTDRLSRLTGMMADKAQDKTVMLVPDGYSAITNTVTGFNQVIAFTSILGAPVLNIIVPSSAFNGQVDLSSGITLGQNQAAYIYINRNATSLFTPAINVANIASVPLDENVFILAVRLGGPNVWMWDGSQVSVGSGLPLEGQLQLEATVPPSDIVIVTPGNIPSFPSSQFTASSSFALLAYSTITNTGSSVISGNVGTFPGTAITGFPPGVIIGTQYLGNAAAHNALIDAQNVYNTLSAMPATSIPSILDGQTLTPGVYTEASGTFNLATSGAATLTLNGSGIYVFIASSTLTTGAGGTPTITLEGGALASDIYWVVGSSATINSGHTGVFEGSIIATASITDTSGGTVNGNLIALNGAITLSAAAIVNATLASPQSGSTQSEKLSSFLLAFGGARINFATGVVYESDGVTPLGVNFTPGTIPANDWLWYSVTLIPSTLNGNNTIGGQLLILPAAATGTTIDSAPRAIFPGNGIPLGEVAVQENSSGTAILPIPQYDIVQLSPGTGSGGTGLIKVDLYDVIDTSLPSVAPALIDGVTVVTGDTVLFSQLSVGNNEVYEATVSAPNPTLPNPIVLQISNANPYAGGNMESVVNAGNVATAQLANDAYFEIDGETAGGPITDVAHDSAYSYENGGAFGISTSLYRADQPFVAGTTGPASSATVVFDWTGVAPSGNIQFQIWSDNGSGLPLAQIGTSGLFDSSTLIQNSGLPATPITVSFPSGINLVSGTLYHLYVDFSTVSFAGGASIQWHHGSTSLVYAPGFVYSLDGGSTYTVAGGANLWYVVDTGGVLTATCAYQSHGNLGNINSAFTASSDVAAQPFIAQVSGNLSGVDFPALSFGLGGNWTLSVYTDNLGVPGTLLSNIVTVPVSTFVDSTSFNAQLPYFVVNFTSGAIVAGTKYWMIWDCSAVTGFSFSTSLFLGSNTSVSVESPAWLFSNNSGGPGYGGGTWTTQTGSNIMYSMYVQGGGSSPFVIAENLSINTSEQETVNTVSLGQTFTSTGNGFFTDAIFQLSILNPTPPNVGNLFVKLYSDSAGQPGTLLETSSPINSASLTTTPTNYTFNFTGLTPVVLGTLYHAILYDGALTGTSSGSITWVPQPVFSTPYVPTDGDEVIILQGDAFANQVAEFNGTTWQVNPVYRSFNGPDFWEISSIITSTLVNNAATQVFSVTALGSENMIVDYSVSRAGNKETGTAWITNNGTVAEVTDGGAYTADVGLTFSAAIVSGNVVLTGTLNNSGGDATLKYTLKRWSDGTTGPTGVPSYSPVLPGISASAFTMSDGSSVPYNCSSPFNILGLTNITLDFSYAVGLNSGSTVGDLSIYVNGQRIPRYVSSTVTPPSGGTYYTEVSSTQIQFTVDITVAPVTVEIIKEA